jgi:hypothetical protein
MYSPNQDRGDLSLDGSLTAVIASYFPRGYDHVLQYTAARLFHHLSWSCKVL